MSRKARLIYRNISLIRSPKMDCADQNNIVVTKEPVSVLTIVKCGMLVCITLALFVTLIIITRHKSARNLISWETSRKPEIHEDKKYLDRRKQILKACLEHMKRDRDLQDANYNLTRCSLFLFYQWKPKSCSCGQDKNWP